MITADLLRAAVLAALSVLILTGHVGIPLLLTAILFVGVAGCFFDAASQAVIPILVGRDKEALARVNGRYWAIDTVGRSLAGPPLGSTAFSVSRALPFAGDAASFVLSALCLSRLPPMPPAGGSQPLMSAIRDGLAHLRATAELKVLAASMATYNFAYNVAMAPFVLYVTGNLHVSDVGYGVLLAVAALGGVVTGWRAAPLTRRFTYRQTMSLATALQSVAWLGIAIAPNAYAAGAFLALIGAASTLTSVAVGSARQALTPDHLLGRVVSAFRLFGVGAAGLGALAYGLVARQVGLHAPLWAATAVLAAAALALVPWRRGASVD
ncbi:MFS transporter [Streptomyces radiopugnans]|nr:MFS transporter [Streptomyces radiopugnans]